jgi:hypothetical protein
MANQPGAHIATYRERPLRPVELLSLGLPGALGVLAPLGYGWYLRQAAQARYGPIAAQEWSRPWFLLALIGLGIFTWLVLYRISRSRGYISLYTGGIVHVFSRPRSLTWEQIAGVAAGPVQNVFLGFRGAQQFRASLLLESGEQLRLSSGIENLPELLTGIKAHLYPKRYTALEEAFEAGRWLNFGPIRIHQDALLIVDRKKPVSWSGVDRLEVKGGYLVVEFYDQPEWRMAVERIPNLEILIKLVQKGVHS